MTDRNGMAAMKKKKGGLVRQAKAFIDEAALFEHVAQIIESRKSRAGACANREVTLMYWEVGRYINSVVLENERAGYGKKILPALAAKLSWSHFIELLPLKTGASRMYYANDAILRHYGAKELRRQTSREAYERRQIANSQLTRVSTVSFNVFKDPYLLDTLGLKEK